MKICAALVVVAILAAPIVHGFVRAGGVGATGAWLRAELDLWRTRRLLRRMEGRPWDEIERELRRRGLYR